MLQLIDYNQTLPLRRNVLYKKIIDLYKTFVRIKIKCSVLNINRQSTKQVSKKILFEFTAKKGLKKTDSLCRKLNDLFLQFEVASLILYKCL